VTRRLLLALAIWLASWPALAQVPTTGAGRGAPSSGGGGCSQATAFLARVTTTWTTAYTTMICGMVTDGTWGDFAALYILATDSTANALTNLISSSFPLTNAGSSSFTTNTGYTGNGLASGTLTSTYNFSTGSPYAANSATIMGWGVGITTADNGAILGGSSGAAATYLQPYSGAATSTGDINGGGNTSVSASNGNGLIALDRSSTTLGTIYLNGSSVGTGTLTSGTLQNETLEIFGYGTFGYLATGHGAAMIGVADSLGATKEANVYSRIHTFLHTVNASAFP
jgi:hypothetical protein